MIETLAGLFLALSSQGIFAETFNWLWFLAVFMVATPAFFYLKTWPPIGGALATMALTLASLAYLGAEVLFRQDTWGWALSMGATGFLVLEFLHDQPKRLFLYSAFLFAILSSFAYQAALFLSPAFFIMLLSFLPKDLALPRASSQILFLYTALSPSGLWFGPAIVQGIGELLKTIM